MRIEDIRSIHGPNIYHHNPVIVMRLQLEDLTETESYEVPGFVARLREKLPGVHDHHCAMGRPGGFIERLYGGTYFGHIVEHVALELTGVADIPAFFGKTLEAGEPGLYDLIVEYRAEEATKYLLRVAVELVQALVDGREFDLRPHLRRAQDIAADTELGPSARAIVDAARHRGIPVRRLNEGSLIQLGTGRYRQRIQSTMTEMTSAIGVDICADKELTKQLLREAGVPVPYGGVAFTEEEAVEWYEYIGEPVAIKPLDGNHGRGVSLNLDRPADVRRAFQLAKSLSEQVLVEQYVQGNNYRLLVVNGQLIAAAERIPAHVIGDGVRSISALVEAVNQDPDRGQGHEKPLTQIRIDPIVIATLTGAGRKLSDIPAVGEKVFLRDSANISTGGIAIDVTDEIHDNYRTMCSRIARAIGLDVCGIDLVTQDITVPPSREHSAVIEVNAAPGIRMHHFPSAGTARDVGAAILDALYPPRAKTRVPIISVTGTNGKTTTTRMIGHIIQSTGKTVGMTTTDGIYVGGQCIMRCDTTGPRSAQTVLSDPTVEFAILETARGGIVRGGLGYELADVGVITNITTDHIGQDGITKMSDLVHIKSLVAECVYPGGVVVLSADDPNQVQLASRIQSRIVYCSMSADNPTVRKHLAIGGTAFFYRDGWLIEATGEKQWKVMRSRDIPVTLYDTAQFHIANSLAAIAACRAQGVARSRITRALAQFGNVSHNPGRSNLYRKGSGYILVDYGHNAESFRAVRSLAAAMGMRRTTAVIGVPGDRADHIITESAAAAAGGYDRIILREDCDLRGRKPGEVADLLRQGVMATAPDKWCVTITDEREAFQFAVDEMVDGELVVLFYEKLDPVLRWLEINEAVPVSYTSELMQPALQTVGVSVL